MKSPVSMMWLAVVDGAVFRFSESPSMAVARDRAKQAQFDEFGGTAAVVASY
ncbi:hypothetical protein AB0D11_39760 [Streptomyces monashensis]|uniref:hypothetical protein n=1 Tax=Streptomyces monashensis TaxID=1678012 RepID=UPI00340D1B96